ncbi:hypothetical protein SK128_019180 [Halocaridina rubra]|uniref:Uncharacterized protein n=1 Tax=Halocaridina rubra TaxID=373956 RepID=A0AAN9A192_HALRR
MEQVGRSTRHICRRWYCLRQYLYAQPRARQFLSVQPRVHLHVLCMPRSKFLPKFRRNAQTSLFPLKTAAVTAAAIPAAAQAVLTAASTTAGGACAHFFTHSQQEASWRESLCISVDCDDET